MLERPINLELYKPIDKSNNSQKQQYKSKHDPKLLPTASSFIISNTNHPNYNNLHGGLSLKDLSKSKASTSYIQNESTFGPKFNSPYDSQHRKRYKLKINRVPNLQELRSKNPDHFCVTHKKTTYKQPLDNSFIIQSNQQNKNFVKDNYENAFKGQNYCEKKTSLKKSEIKDYLKKTNYGKVPKYLTKLKKINENLNISDFKNKLSVERDELEGLQENEMTLLSPNKKSNSDEMLSEEEKQTILSKLKAKWVYFNFEYQKSTHCNQFLTHRQTKKKLELEKVLDEIEKCIHNVEKTRII